MDLPSINISLIGWIFILAAVILLAAGIVHFLGHLLHWIVRGCGIILVALALLYALHLLKVI